MDFIRFIITDLVLIALPAVLLIAMYKLWAVYIRDRSYSEIKWKMYEIRVPLDVVKSPLAMEIFFVNGLFHKASPDWWSNYVEGVKYAFFSLEMVSFGGDVRFFVRTPATTAKLVESQLYAQYPQVEIIPVEHDYAMKISRVGPGSKYDVWGSEFVKVNPEVLPIKTYVDYGLDKLDLKDEYKIDPLSSVYELLASIKPGEQLWIQYVVRRSQRKYHPKNWLDDGHDYRQEVEHQLNNIAKKYNVPKIDPKTGETTYELRIPDTTDRDRIEALRNAAKKLPFDTGIRVVYAAEREVFDKSIKSGVKIMFSQFAAPTVNELKGKNSIGFDWPWQDFRGSLDNAKNTLLANYKKREFFNPSIIGEFGIPFLSFPGKGHFFPDQTPEYCVFNTEELASLWHFPGRSIGTPSIERIETRTSKPPANLPF